MTFHDDFVALFHAHYQRLYRYLSRMSGEPDLAADLAQEALVRLYQRGSPPERPEAWLVTVAMNLLRNARSKESTQLRLLTASRGEAALADPPLSPAEALEGVETRGRVRRALDRLPERERQMLLLLAEGYRYRDIAAALDLNAASVGTLLARAKRAFCDLYEETSDAPRG